MTGRFLVLRFVWLGILSSFLERLFPLHLPSELFVPLGYTLEHWMKRQPANEESSVGVFCDDRTGRRVVIKKIRSRFPVLPYQQMLNDAAVLQWLQGKVFPVSANRKVSFPSLLKLERSCGRSIIVKTYMEGKTLGTLPVDDQIMILEECINVLRSLSARISLPLGTRWVGCLLWMAPFHLVKATRKQYREWKVLVWAVKSLLKYFPSVVFRPAEYVATHFDLSPENILVDGEAITILDVDMMASTHPITEVALCARYHLINFGKRGTLRFLERNLASNTEQKQFLALTVYYAIQILSIGRRKGRYALETLRYLRFLMENETAIVSGTHR